MWIERRMRSGPGRRRQTRRPALLDAIGEDRPGPLVRTDVSTGGRAGRRRHRTPSGHHLHSGADVIRRPNVSKSPDQVETAVGEQSPERTETGRAAPKRGAEATGSRTVEERSSRRPSPGRTPSTDGWRYASRDRTHRSARDWQRYVVGKVRLSPRTAEDPGAGAGGVATRKVAGARVGEAPAISDLECWRDPTGSRYERRC